MEREQLEQAIAALEARRDALGDAVVDAALGPMRQRLAELAHAGGQKAPSLEDERKLVTVMFADISGFTPLAERLDPEAVRELMTACFDRLVPVIEKYEGTVEKFIGDEIYAIFGAPVSDASCDTMMTWGLSSAAVSLLNLYIVNDVFLVWPTHPKGALPWATSIPIQTLD